MPPATFRGRAAKCSASRLPFLPSPPFATSSSILSPICTPGWSARRPRPHRKAKKVRCRGPAFAVLAGQILMSLLRSLFWFTLFLASTFAFTVLFEHGTSDFQNNAKKEFDYLSQMFGAKPQKKKDESERIGGGMR